MFGIIDSFSILINSSSKKFNSTFKRHVIKQTSTLTWVCFLPWRVGIEDAKKLGFIPDKGNVIAYEMPDNILSADPKLTLDSIKDIGRDLEKTYTELNLTQKQLAFLGVSAGTLPAFFFANKYPSTKLIAICPTDRLGEGIFLAFAARNIKKESIKKGYTAEKYDKIIYEINPENNTSNLPSDITIYLSRFDKFVPYKGGLSLVEKIRKNNKNVTIKIFNLLGHMPVLYLFGKKKNKFAPN